MSIPSTLISCFIGLASCGLNGFTDRELIVAHRSRSAQGRVHFITTLSCLSRYPRAHRTLDRASEVWYTPGTQREEVAMFGVGLPELVVILAVALIVLGPQRLPEVARMLGRAYGQLRRASEEFQNTIRQDLAALERQEDANRNKAIAQEIRERWADVEDVQTAIIQERDGHG